MWEWYMWLGNDGGIGLENDSLFTQLYNWVVYNTAFTLGLYIYVLSLSMLLIRVIGYKKERKVDFDSLTELFTMIWSSVVLKFIDIWECSLL